MSTRECAAGLDDATGRLDAVHARHPHVHQHDVGFERRRLPDGLGAVARLTDDGHVVLRLQHHPKAQPQQRLVVDEQHSRQDAPLTCLAPHVRAAGSVAPVRSAPGQGHRRWRHPSPYPPAAARAGPASTVPPYTAVRARIPLIPCPSPDPAPRPGQAATTGRHDRRPAPTRPPHDRRN